MAPQMPRFAQIQKTVWNFKHCALRVYNGKNEIANWQNLTKRLLVKRMKLYFMYSRRESISCLTISWQNIPQSHIPVCWWCQHFATITTPTKQFPNIFIEIVLIEI